MHSVKLTVFIEDHADLDMEVRVVAADHDVAVAGAPVAQVAPVAVIKPRIVPVPPPNDDEYTLGGYAGI
ncbi:hypothetical protein BJI69_07685 [Luteibacter rhizovicinus DSM 16549]|uniref:Uncharacterized protein n=1 Tax=Luteibacter rhizovicinus DSM 16549 TaxID=1440763 RepID=A0A0G9H532_9GAMM|nr:hypothetical protein [Luteibacter rhizovicinus]APG03802.1 hypothetical protein BJI69_07685 [Luteibacter rhizovicinus DSM 16549]KLD64324.1 hypothetical protein Y883_18155 [Luteibacter rhizovicinus DSM 16549]KLD75160.1 hypothetical protein Y886_28625 [Xanthomonas hyacinthi DSM 19077]